MYKDSGRCDQAEFLSSQHTVPLHTHTLFQRLEISEECFFVGVLGGLRWENDADDAANGWGKQPFFLLYANLSGWSASACARSHSVGEREGSVVEDVAQGWRWMCRSSINMYGMLYIKTDSTQVNSTRTEQKLISKNAKRKRSKMKIKEKPSNGKTYSNELKSTRLSRVRALSRRRSWRRRWRWSWTGATRKGHLCCRRRLWLGLGLGSYIGGWLAGPQPGPGADTDWQASNGSCCRYSCCCSFGWVHEGNITQQNAIKHFVATWRCEQQMLIKGVWLCVGERANCGGYTQTHTHARTHRTHKLPYRWARQKKWENSFSAWSWVATVSVSGWVGDWVVGWFLLI